MTLTAINDLRRHTATMRAELQSAVARVIESGWFVLGPEVRQFEHEFAAYCGAAHAVSLANGTDALELALRALGIGAGSRVLTVGNAGMYSTTAICAVGAVPVFADIAADTLLLDVSQLEEALNGSSRPDAVIVTHLYGLLWNIERIVTLAQSAGVPVVEDCAQAHGAMVNGKRAGTFGALGCFSFYPTKNLGALGDGGAVVTDDADLAATIRQLRQYGWSEKYVSSRPGGRNSRLDEMQAAVLRAKLPLLDSWNGRRRSIANRYSKEIRNSKLQCPRVEGENFVAHLYVVRTPDRLGLKDHLSRCGIPSDIHYPVPDFKQPSIAGRLGEVSLPVTESACQEVLTLPCFPEMTDDEVMSVIAAVNSW